MPSTFKKSTVREYFESIVIAVILALFVRTWVVQAFKIPTGSMENNLLIGDHLLVNKFVFGPRRFDNEEKLLPVREPRRGDIVVFKYPDEPERDFIKRVIGLPGDTLELRNKKVFVNGQPLDEPYVHFLEPPLRPGDPEFGLRIEGRGDNWGPEVVPPGQLFVLGDNRDNSKDSRYWGFLPIDQVKGRALMVYWSYEASREEYRRTGMDWVRDTLAAFGKTRWRRFFHLIR
jgi:signal peptidase I